MSAKKPSIRFTCTNCGAMYSAWAGRCNTCGEWNTLQEEAVIALGGSGGSAKPIETVSALSVSKKDSSRRIKVGINEVDDVLGGGLVPGSVVLIAGQPGIGKSTLLLQISAYLASGAKVLYISGEESTHQVGLRASRLKAGSSKLQIAVSTSAEDIAATMSSGKYDVVIVDSIQAISVSSVGALAGTVSQITNSTHVLMSAAKQTNTAVIMVGHVTKEGSIAGPKVLEHVVDVVLQLEGDRYGGFKILRSVKNRFGSTNEAGIFEMQDEGLKPVDNPSAALLAERQITDGSVVLATMEGSRALLVEVQALVNKTSYGYPKRTASGISLNRLNLLVAMLEKRTKLNLSDQDIYINIVGGINISEPAADLAICMAIGSASKGLKLKDNAVVFGEVGLSGEVRHVPFADKRLAEAKKLGFKTSIGPKVQGSKKLAGLQSVGSVREALNTYLHS